MAYCDYCGKYGEERAGSGPMTGNIAPAGWITVRKGFFKVLWFCSRKCKDDAG